jgi:hypothetical protein
MEIFLTLILFFFIAYLLSFFVNPKNTNRSNKKTTNRSKNKRDENIRLNETVGHFSKGDESYCNDCDSVCIHLEEKFLGETSAFFGIFSFFIPWKWVLLATIFKFWDKEYQTVCTNCYPDFYDDWKLLKRKKRKQNLRAFLIILISILCLYLYL